MKKIPRMILGCTLAAALALTACSRSDSGPSGSMSTNMGGSSSQTGQAGQNAAYRTGLGILTEASDQERAGKIDTIAAAVLLDAEGRVADVMLDEVEISVTGDSTGKVTMPTDDRTKRQKGDDYPLAAVSSLKKGWAEQADAFGNYLTGKTPDEVKKLATDDDGKPKDADLLSTCTIAVDGIVQPYADSPLDEEPMAETVYLNILAQAQQYIYIYTPYLAVGEEMLDALKNAAKRGVDIRLVLPGIPDKKLVFRLSRSYYLPLLRAGVRIYEYTPGFLHAKCWVSDDVTAVVGSINMDYRSLFLHFECGVLLQKNSQVAVLRDDVRATLPQCREIQVTECRTSLPGTVLDSVLRLLSPLM